MPTPPRRFGIFFCSWVQAAAAVQSTGKAQVSLRHDGGLSAGGTPHPITPPPSSSGRRRLPQPRAPIASPRAGADPDLQLLRRDFGPHPITPAPSPSGRRRLPQPRASRHRPHLASSRIGAEFTRFSHRRPHQVASAGRHSRFSKVRPQRGSWAGAFEQPAHALLEENVPANASHLEVVRDALRHLWHGYRSAAWGSDEVRPLSGQRGGQWGDVGMAVLDTMDTLWLADLHKEFDEGEQWVANMRLEKSHKGYKSSFFETTIRGLGGLLSSYALSRRPVFLEKAKDLGNRLLQAFPENSSLPGKYHSWPAAYIDIRSPKDTEVAASWLGESILADVGSNVLEFAYLSEISGDTRYKVAADSNEAELVHLSSKTQRHLAPKFLDPGSHAFATKDASVGAFGDSYFEYLLKSYLQSGRTEHALLTEWKLAMGEMRNRLLRTSKGGFTYVAVDPRSDEMDHLSCFMGGLLALGSHLVPQDEREDWWLPAGAEITRTCYEMYHQSPSGLAAESSAIGHKIVAVDRGYRIRPETLESLFYLHRITGNETYRQWSWEIFSAINKHTRTKWGFASVQDVTRLPVALLDSEETFVGAETLKYALLVHLPPTVLPLESFVFNTEAHPLPVVEQSSSYLS